MDSLNNLLVSWWLNIIHFETILNFNVVLILFHFQNNYCDDGTIGTLKYKKAKNTVELS